MADFPETSYEYTKGMNKQSFLSMVDQYVSGKIVFLDDIKHVLNVYGSTWRREVNTIPWRQFDD